MGMSEFLSEVLAHYGLYPLEVNQQTDNVYKVYTNHGAVAVKRTDMDDQQIKQWIATYQQANESQLSSLMPLYMTSNQELYVQQRNHTWYIMPWVETPHRDTPPYPFDLFYSSLADIHRRTSKTQVVKREDFEDRMESKKNQIRADKDKLEGYVEAFEKHHYMAPFELQVCTHFRDLLYVFEISEEWCDRFLEDIEEDKKIRLTLCHGDLKPSHFIYDENKPYFLNWERASWNYPVFDLTSYYWNIIKYHDAPVEQLVTTFSSYEERFNLMNSERCLFALYLLSPDHYLDQVDAYVSGARNSGQPFLVQKLEHSYYVLQHSLQIQSQIEKAREYIQQQEEEKEQEEG
ncbi:phosphotransferase [Pontibacillus yanchengensis]|uniref:Phosphotransferase n=1 Tax=Pontibacillus yanchengensis TaxID=462910 RepID=A0ACC7VGU2_9BACI|nr:phosphotransferase [Pontibacillus yanchengensis]